MQPEVGTPTSPTPLWGGAKDGCAPSTEGLGHTAEPVSDGSPSSVGNLVSDQPEESRRHSTPILPDRTLLAPPRLPKGWLKTGNGLGQGALRSPQYSIAVSRAHSSTENSDHEAAVPHRRSTTSQLARILRPDARFTGRNGKLDATPLKDNGQRPALKKGVKSDGFPRIEPLEDGRDSPNSSQGSPGNSESRNGAVDALGLLRSQLSHGPHVLLHVETKRYDNEDGTPTTVYSERVDPSFRNLESRGGSVAFGSFNKLQHLQTLADTLETYGCGADAVQPKKSDQKLRRMSTVVGRLLGRSPKECSEKPEEPAKLRQTAELAVFHRNLVKWGAHAETRWGKTCLMNKQPGPVTTRLSGIAALDVAQCFATLVGHGRDFLRQGIVSSWINVSEVWRVQKQTNWRRGPSSARLKLAEHSVDKLMTCMELDPHGHEIQAVLKDFSSWLEQHWYPFGMALEECWRLKRGATPLNVMLHLVAHHLLTSAFRLFYLGTLCNIVRIGEEIQKYVEDQLAHPSSRPTALMSSVQLKADVEKRKSTCIALVKMLDEEVIPAGKVATSFFGIMAKAIGTCRVARVLHIPHQMQVNPLQFSQQMDTQLSILQFPLFSSQSGEPLVVGAVKFQESIVHGIDLNLKSNSQEGSMSGELRKFLGQREDTKTPVVSPFRRRRATFWSADSFEDHKLVALQEMVSEILEESSLTKGTMRWHQLNLELTDLRRCISVDIVESSVLAGFFLSNPTSQPPSPRPDYRFTARTALTSDFLQANVGGLAYGNWLAGGRAIHRGPQPSQVVFQAQPIQNSSNVLPTQHPQLVQASQHPQFVQAAQHPQLVQAAQHPQLVQAAAQHPQLLQAAQHPQLVQPTQATSASPDRGRATYSYPVKTPWPHNLQWSISAMQGKVT